MAFGTLLRGWKNLSIFKKLYGVVGLMALLIAVELFTMLFTMDVLSAVRSFVGGEGIWSKAQKDSIQSLHKYVFTLDRKYYLEFEQHLQIPYGDGIARAELLKPDPDLEKVRQGFAQGNIHPQDIDGLIRLLQRFYYVSYIEEAIDIWTEAEAHLDKLVDAARELDVAISAKPRSREDILRALDKVDVLNAQMTVLENKFSRVLGEGSRWLEGQLRYLLIFMVLVVESTGIYLTFAFSRNLSRSIKEMSEAALKVGEGDFSKRVPVNSEDELGQLSRTINNMIENLEASIGHRLKAESDSQTKSLFLANMSHEIRTPLGVILGFTELLKQEDLSREDQQKFVATIERTGHDLKQIINDILDISKVEAGYLEIEKSRFSLSQFLQDLHVALSSRAIKNSNALVFSTLTAGQNDSVVTDRVRLRQILVNILGNALKFTKDGRVELDFWFDGALLNFRIKDNGIGMSESDAKQLFQAFSQLDSSTTRKYGGTGLGLFLSKKLAQKLGGDIVLESSRPGQGSSFHVWVEALVGETSSQNLSTASGLLEVPKRFADKKVLIIDDSPENQLLVQTFLKKWGLQFEEAINGKEGVEKACSGDFDLVLMDIQMPIMDGYEATRELRRRNYTRPVIALTAHAMKIDKERCLNAGCDEYVTKPLDFKVLFDTLARFLG